MPLNKRKGVNMMLTGENINRFSVHVLRKRLELELKFPEFTKGRTGLATLRGCRALGFDGRTRKQALAWINEKIDAE